MKFKFEMVDEDGVVRTMELPPSDKFVYWPAVLTHFQEFLAGCGFLFHTNFDISSLSQSEHDRLMSEKYAPYNKSNSPGQE